MTRGAPANRRPGSNDRHLRAGACGRGGSGGRCGGRWRGHIGETAMGDPTGFLRTPREAARGRPVLLRLRDWREVRGPVGDEQERLQAGRCMDCGVPFCHAGCPLGNLIPKWNELVGGVSGSAPRISCTPRTTFRSSRARCARLRARTLAYCDQRRAGHDQGDRAARSLTAPVPKGGSCRSARRPDRLHGGRGRLRSGRAGRRPAADQGRS